MIHLLVRMMKTQITEMFSRNILSLGLYKTLGFILFYFVIPYFFPLIMFFLFCLRWVAAMDPERQKRKEEIQKALGFIQ